jgi:hypothetical protein
LSWRSLIEMNHDLGPRIDDDGTVLAWARALLLYRSTCDPVDLPEGMAYKYRRYHADPCPLEFERRVNRSKSK